MHRISDLQKERRQVERLAACAARAEHEWHAVEGDAASSLDEIAAVRSAARRARRVYTRRYLALRRRIAEIVRKRGIAPTRRRVSKIFDELRKPNPMISAGRGDGGRS